MKHLLSISDLDKSTIENILNYSEELENSSSDILKGKNIVFVFEKPSLRTKVATEVALNHLGADVVHIEPANFLEWNILFASKTAHNPIGRESLKDTVKNVSNWCDAIFLRVFSHQTLINITEFSHIPVINALSDTDHPMQALADLLTVRQIFGQDNISLAFVGDANNVAFSLLEILLIFGYDVRMASPKLYFFTKEKQKYFENLAKDNWGKILFTNDPIAAVENASVVYADTFVSMGEEDEFDEKMKSFDGFQVNTELLSYANKQCYFMHCLPAHRGIEVTDEVIDSPYSLVYRQAKNRMVVSKWVFATLLKS